MAYPTWPANLPQRVVVDGYSETFRDGRLFSRTSGGPPKVRRRFSSSPMPVSATLALDYDQKAMLERFWEEDTSGGALPFYIPDQSHDGIQLLDESGDPILTGGDSPLLITAKWLALFGEEAPKVTPWGLQFMASFTLMVMP